MYLMPLPILFTATFVCAWLTIISAPWALDRTCMNFVFKPLTTLLIIAYAWPRGRRWPELRRGVLAGLMLSLCGDVALLWPQQGFLPGLVSFLLAHLAYLWAFSRSGVRLAARWLPFLIYAALAAIILGLLWPGVPAALRLPVLAYVLCLASMAAQAAAVAMVALQPPAQPGAWRAGALAVGGALFLVSDALLATNRFAGPLPLAGLWILATYSLAQVLIATWLEPPASQPTSP